MTETTEQTAAPPRRWDPIVKLTHWGIVAAVIGNALVTEEGSGWHIWVGYGLAALLGLRLLWGLIGPREARFSAFPPSPGRAVKHLGEIGRGEVTRHASHNPLGALMVYAIWGTLLVVIGSGIAMSGPPPANPSAVEGKEGGEKGEAAESEGRESEAMEGRAGEGKAEEARERGEQAAPAPQSPVTGAAAAREEQEERGEREEAGERKTPVVAQAPATPPALPVGAAVAPAAARAEAGEGSEAGEGGEGEEDEAMEEVHEIAVNLLYLLIALHLMGVVFETRRSGREIVGAMLPGGNRRT